MTHLEPEYRCDCGWVGREDEMYSICTFAGSIYEPAEYENYCPCCNNHTDYMEELIDE